VFTRNKILAVAATACALAVAAPVASANAAGPLASAPIGYGGNGGYGGYGDHHGYWHGDHGYPPYYHHGYGSDSD
jgi:hypothetical protein